MIHLTWNQEFGTYAAILGGVQLFVAARFFLVLSRDAARARPAYFPPASLILACKGADGEFARNMRAFLRQDYAGPLEVLFVVPAESDPAVAVLRELTREEGAAPARVLVSNLVPQRSSGKVVDLLFALERVSPRSEVLAFADCDLRTRPDWLAEMVAPLEDAGVMATTCVMLYIPASDRFWTWMRSVEIAAALMYSSLASWVNGQSYAVRRADFDRIGVREVWAVSVLEDIPLSDCVKRAGGRVRYVTRATPVSTEDCDRRGFFGLFNKWIVFCRFYAPTVWVAGLLGVFAHLWIFFWSCYPPRVHWGMLAFLFAGDAGFLALAFALLERYLPDRFADAHPSARPLALRAALTAPALWACVAAQFAQSALTREVRWGGRVYRINGPNDIEIRA
jgi:cellulose synthase/poly-beta-1,6-N-acetylglucosamine synthase-like glycosyltransferase